LSRKLVDTSFKKKALSYLPLAFSRLKETAKSERLIANSFNKFGGKE